MEAIKHFLSRLIAEDALSDFGKDKATRAELRTFASQQTTVEDWPEIFQDAVFIKYYFFYYRLYREFPPISVIWPLLKTRSFLPL